MTFHGIFSLGKQSSTTFKDFLFRRLRFMIKHALKLYVNLCFVTTHFQKLVIREIKSV